jgi:hypothetical protein
MMTRAYGTRGWWTKGRRAIRLDRCAIPIADSRHIEHDGDEAKRKELERDYGDLLSGVASSETELSDLMLRRTSMH